MKRQTGTSLKCLRHRESSGEDQHSHCKPVQQRVQRYCSALCVLRVFDRGARKRREFFPLSSGSRRTRRTFPGDCHQRLQTSSFLSWVRRSRNLRHCCCEESAATTPHRTFLSFLLFYDLGKRGTVEDEGIEAGKGKDWVGRRKGRKPRPYTNKYALSRKAHGWG